MDKINKLIKKWCYKKFCQVTVVKDKDEIRFYKNGELRHTFKDSKKWTYQEWV